MVPELAASRCHHGGWWNGDAQAHTGDERWGPQRMKACQASWSLNLPKTSG